MSCCVAVLFVLGSMVSAGAGAQTTTAAFAVEASEPDPEIVPPRVILASKSAPAYPPAALAGRFEGVVELRAKIRTDGTVGAVDVLRCDHAQLGFEESSVVAVRSWRFRPAHRAGVPIEADTTLLVTFRNGGNGVLRGTFVTAGAVNATAQGASRASTTLAKR